MPFFVALNITHKSSIYLLLIFDITYTAFLIENQGYICLDVFLQSSILETISNLLPFPSWIWLLAWSDKARKKTPSLLLPLSYRFVVKHIKKLYNSAFPTNNTCFTRKFSCVSGLRNHWQCWWACILNSINTEESWSAPLWKHGLRKSYNEIKMYQRSWKGIWARKSCAFLVKNYSHRLNVLPTQCKFKDRIWQLA